MKIITKSSAQTKKVGETIAKEVLKTKTEKAFVFGLRGDLGSGKTAFTQGFAKGLGIKEKISSPTFVLMKKFEIPIKNKKQKNNNKKAIVNIKGKRKKSNFENFYHFDFYRIKIKKEILDFGFQEIVSNPKNIIVIEWPKFITSLTSVTSLSCHKPNLHSATRLAYRNHSVIGSTYHNRQRVSRAYFIEINFEFIDPKTRRIIL